MQKILHVCIIIIIIISIVFTALMLILRYDEKGEENMPFEISKISIISIVDSQDVEDRQNKWNKIVDQNNDVYLYISKNNEYKKTETIDKVVLSNFKTAKSPQKGMLGIYKPSNNEKALFENKDEFKSKELTFIGAQETNKQNMQISNQGGIIVFRCANCNVGNYISNEDSQIVNEELLKKINILNEDLKTTISFDVDIVLSNGLTYQTNIEINIPEGDIVENGKTSIEKTDLNFVFKRIEK